MPVFVVSSNLVPQTGHTDVGNSLACLNSFVREGCELEPVGSFLFLLLEVFPLSSDGEDLLVPVSGAVVGPAVKPPISFICTGLALPSAWTLSSDSLVVSDLLRCLLESVP